MKTRIVYVSPTTSNQRLVDKLQRMPPLTDVEFRFLHTDSDRRRNELERLPPGLVYLWGDGYQHHESFVLTDPGVKLKVNVDNHSDTADASFVSYGSHMRHTLRTGTRIVTPSQSLHQLEKRTRLISDVHREVGFVGSDTVHLTLDFDALTSFPACYEWVCTDGISIPEVASLTQRINGRLRTLDMGGLIEDSPDFELIKIGDFVPTRDMTLRVLKELDTDQGHINLVMSYATMAYYGVLVAALFT
ncbi:MAG TPA: hypothetical protein VI912_03835 [Candidatus Bilamarchaeaceae archaeon]|nr:hypothetical protein [Candidatus Bilamarchaeaceae archaeon]